MAMTYFYCDESGKYRKNPVISITGVGASAERSERFQAEWTALLRSYGLLPELHMSHVLDLTQANGPKMPAGQTLDERTEALIPFADCINNHLEIGLMQAWDVKGYNNLPMETKKLLGGSSDPYQLAFVRGLLAIAEWVGESGTISLICDDDEVVSWNTHNHYRAIKKALPEIDHNFAGITFGKSQYFTPLQAADMAAFLCRREASERFWQKPNEWKRLTEYLVGGPTTDSRGLMNWFAMFADESGLAELAVDIATQKRNGAS